MLWNKKEEKSALPDLPPLEMPFKQELASIQKKEEAAEEEESVETHALPSFPDPHNAKGFSQAAIKDAVSDDIKEKEVESIGKIPQDYKTVEMQDSPDVAHPSIIESKPVPYHEQTTYQINSALNDGIIPNPPIPQPKPALISPPLSTKHEHVEHFTPLPSHFSRPPLQEKHTHVFVKIDKFFSARKALEETKSQLNQIDFSRLIL